MNPDPSCAVWHCLPHRLPDHGLVPCGQCLALPTGPPLLPMDPYPRKQAMVLPALPSYANYPPSLFRNNVNDLKYFPFGRRSPCDIYWHGVSFHDNNIFSGQVNKFPGMTEMVRKITLSRAVRIMQNLFPEEYNFYPRSWILPDEFQLFTAQVQMVKDGDPSWKPTFIVKPDGGCQGDGIYLIKDPSDIRLSGTLQRRPAVVQEYICKPLLIDKLKFDIRLYVLLKSLDPLEIYIAKDGLSRFCTEPYQEPTPKNLHHIFMHLTNYSLNIHSGNFVHSDSTSTGSKRTFSSILCRLSSKGVDIKKVWSDIISLVIKTVIALTPELKVFYQSDIPAGRPGPTCFQILGFDILLMKNLKPILLEVNANPSMRIEHEQELSPGVFENVPSLVDEEVKVAVIRDTLRLMDPLRKKRENHDGVPPLLTWCFSLKSSSRGESKTIRRGPQSQFIDFWCLYNIYNSYSSCQSHLPSGRLERLFKGHSFLFNLLKAKVLMPFLGITHRLFGGTFKNASTGWSTEQMSCGAQTSALKLAVPEILLLALGRRWYAWFPHQRNSGGEGCPSASFINCFWSAYRVQDSNVSTQPQFSLTQLHAAGAITAQFILVSEDAETCWLGVIMAGFLELFFFFKGKRMRMSGSQSCAGALLYLCPHDLSQWDKGAESMGHSHRVGMSLSLQDCLAHGRGAARLGLKQGPFSAEPGQGLVAKST
ncbi:hypothetical protein QTO34_005192 [Cnephaeus nilssonii]|uniref:Tubulin polyglutamylase TTLL11 n=1 Tax=Cnephaeus nilssonii TaxID=3371016 RepID=A0AA40HMY2_CNENI|nr:hypothetical protein QTO34_005192 [Eptesicus nilssonii]